MCVYRQTLYSCLYFFQLPIKQEEDSACNATLYPDYQAHTHLDARTRSKWESLHKKKLPLDELIVHLQKTYTAMESHLDWANKSSPSLQASPLCAAALE
jgi:hypothetical protein